MVDYSRSPLGDDFITNDVYQIEQDKTQTHTEVTTSINEDTGEEEN